MAVHIVWGAADGETPLSAFDRALERANIHNYNLVTLSSIIPPDEPVVESGTFDREWPVGSFVGTVLSEHRSSTPGETIAAGLGWATAREGGVFYEASGGSVEAVESVIRDGLNDARRIREWQWNEGLSTRVVSHEVESVGAVQTCAVFPSRPLRTE